VLTESGARQNDHVLDQRRTDGKQRNQQRGKRSPQDDGENSPLGDEASRKTGDIGTGTYEEALKASGFVDYEIILDHLQDPKLNATTPKE